MITKHKFKYNTIGYFRGNAHEIVMATFGKKHDPIGAKAYVEPEGQINRRYLNGHVKMGTIADINWSRENRADVEVNGNFNIYGVNGQVNASGDLRDADSVDAKLAYFYIYPNQVENILNNEARVARTFLADEGKDGRVVTGIWVVLEATLASEFEAKGSTSLSASALGQNLSITVGGGTKSAQSITVSPGSTFAYSLHKVKKWNRGKTRVEDLEDDKKGMG